ncbi:uncharacterized protein P174DRAFT_425696 [Aspergillus novofumigatus IBT 16806]|uniref:Uncharacterized protein n=1 Tax=Aspergillus novofumigatus (strain IBT 16806) TaxID=1392255 RepID=A0A2I1BTD9_ASPN1|nr:uncharacterized protein P174DRAFT_425696 [Aspergillus novofumigatus IBT 16806]PKX88668.1 hypothetical protein P174DRAFT_425696 [Aspergillus novofumigatus IBT 16806]
MSRVFHQNVSLALSSTASFASVNGPLVGKIPILEGEHCVSNKETNWWAIIAFACEPPKCPKGTIFDKASQDCALKQEPKCKEGEVYNGEHCALASGRRIDYQFCSTVGAGTSEGQKPDGAKEQGEWIRKQWMGPEKQDTDGGWGGGGGWKPDDGKKQESPGWKPGPWKDSRLPADGRRRLGRKVSIGLLKVMILIFRHSFIPRK